MGPQPVANLFDTRRAHPHIKGERVFVFPATALTRKEKIAAQEMTMPA
jgi:hypothetical protein